MTAGSDDVSNLYRLARLCGVDVEVREQSFAPDVLLSALRALGVPVASLADVSRILDAHRLEIWDWRLEPVTVAWGGTGNGVLRMPADDAHLRIDCNMRLEDGDGHGWGVNLTDVPPFAHEVIEGEVFVAKLLPLRSLPFGYHRLTVDLPGHHTESLVISAPVQVYQTEEGAENIEPITALLEASGGFGPVELRRSGYESLIESLRSLLGAESAVVIENPAAWLRPPFAQGSTQSDALRLRYEVEELLGLLCVESYRAQASVLVRNGEDVPTDIEAACERHGIRRVGDRTHVEALVGYPNWRRRIGPSIEELDGAIGQSRTLDVLREHRPWPRD